MEKLNKHIKVLLFISIILSLFLPMGVLSIVFGAVYDFIFLLVIGIIMTALGFYLMPLMWIWYGENKVLKSILYMIEKENLHTTAEIASQLGKSENQVAVYIRKLIFKNYLVGYIFKRDSELILKTIVKQTKNKMPTNKCPNCGGKMEGDGFKYVCQYCDSVYKNLK